VSREETSGRANVAFLTAGCMLPGWPGHREDYWEHGLEFAPLREACARRGIDLHEVVWDDPALVMEGWDAFIIGTTWDYWDKIDAFLAALETFERHGALFNPASVARWNHRKSYLRDLASRGAPVVPTLWLERVDPGALLAAFDVLGVDEIVVKPLVGASAWRTCRVARGGPLPGPEALPPAEALIQPFLAAAVTEGEYAFVFFDRVFSHCARKIPAPGDYRVQSMYGAREEVYEPRPGELDAARRVLDAVDAPLLYARVDMMRLPDGRLAVMELELIEPYLYPEQGPEMGEAFAAALERALGRG